MANIIGLQQRQEALRDIQNVIKEVAVANAFVAASNPSGAYSIGFTDEAGKKHKIDLTGYKEDLDALIKRDKEAKKGYVLNLAQQHRIALDPEDNEILGIENAEG